MKSRKIVAYLMALAIIGTAASATFAVSAEETTPIAGSTAYGLEATELDGVIYNIYNEEGTEAYALVAKVSSEKASAYIIDTIGTVPVVGVERDAFSDAKQLKSITVSANNKKLRAITGCLYEYVYYKNEKNEDVWEDKLIAVPGGLTSFGLPATCVGFYWGNNEAGEKVHADFPNASVVGVLDVNNKKYKVVDNKLYYFTVNPVPVPNGDGTFRTDNQILIGALANDAIKWSVGAPPAQPTQPGATTTAPGATTAPPPPQTDINGSTIVPPQQTPPQQQAPKTGVAGVGVAVATLLAAGSTAIVLRKRSR